METTTLTGNSNLVNSGFENPPENPLHLLQRWLEQADSLKIIEPRALVLSTMKDISKPSSRVVLLKTVNDTGVIFASSEVSQKGKDIEANPVAAGTLWWRETMQQINFSGQVSLTPEHIAEDIFKNRMRESQAVAVLSRQSAPMTDENDLREKVSKMAKESEAIMKPAHWHAYQITIDTIEFWHGQQSRFHDRLRYDLKHDAWQHQKLQP